LEEGNMTNTAGDHPGVTHVAYATAQGTQGSDIVAFGPFRLLAAQRILEKNGVPLKVGDRPLDILIALVEHAAKVVTKAELLAKVWPNLIVEEGCLRVHITALRKALGDGQGGAHFVSTIHGRGYCFVAPLLRQGATAPQSDCRPACQFPFHSGSQ
jgi:DNA-binding winged helix-turn-helix (wHTH) protein